MINITPIISRKGFNEVNCLIINIKAFLTHLEYLSSENSIKEIVKENIEDSIKESLEFIKDSNNSFVIINFLDMEISNFQDIVNLKYKSIIGILHSFKTNDFTVLKNYWIDVQENSFEELAEIIKEVIKQI